MTATAVVAVAQVGSKAEKRIRDAGWEPGRSNGFTQTWRKAYDAAEHALCDARILPADVVWALEAA